MKGPFDRTKLLLGKENIERLKRKHVAVFGIGGVGSYACEALARSGIENMTIIDYDIIDITNINRQIHANFNTLGKQKIAVMKKRILAINPDMSVKTYNECFNKDNKESIFKKDYDYVIDAIDMVSSKVELIVESKRRRIPIISAMGAANKLNPTRLKVGDIYDTHTCPLAKVMRRKLRQKKIDSLKVVWSDERPISTKGLGTVPFVPPVSGLIIASEVIKDLLQKEGFEWSE